MFKKCFALLFTMTLAISAMDEEQEQWVRQILQKMSVRQKVAQLVWPAVPCDPDGVTIPDRLNMYGLSAEGYAQKMIREYDIGGFLYICLGSAQKEVSFTNRLQSLSDVPLLFCQDFEPGMIRNPELYRLPRQMTLGALQNEELIRDIGTILGLRAKVMGSHVVFAPVADVNNNAKNPVINDRSFGEVPKMVARKAGLLMEGISQHAEPVCKHAPGHGDTDVDSHKGLPSIMHNMDRLNRVEFTPFKELIGKGIRAIMTAHILFPNLDKNFPATLSHAIVTDVIRKEWGFGGLLVTDGLNMGALLDNYDDIALKAYLAGNTVLLFPYDASIAIESLVKAVSDGAISEQDLDTRVSAVLKLKASMNLHEQKIVSEENVLERLNNDDVRDLKRRVYHESLTLLKTDDCIPLADPERTLIIQVGSALQFTETLSSCGYDNGCAISAIPSEEEMKKILDAVEKYDVIVVALAGMNKFAAQNFGIADTILSFLNTEVSHKKIILTLFGNPYALSLFGAQDGILEAYEDDEDAQEGAALILLGQLKAQGRLPVTASEQFTCGMGL